MPMIEHNGDQFKYILTIAETGLTPKNVEISDWQKANYTMNTNNIFTAYNITIKAHNEKGDSTAELKPIIGYSGEDSKCENNNTWWVKNYTAAKINWILNQIHVV